MKKNTDTLLTELYSVLPEAKGDSKSWEKMIRGFAKKRPNSKMNPEFRERLHSDLLKAIDQKKEKKMSAPPILGNWFKLFAGFAGGFLIFALVGISLIKNKPLESLPNIHVPSPHSEPKSDFESKQASELDAATVKQTNATDRKKQTVIPSDEVTFIEEPAVDEKVSLENVYYAPITDSEPGPMTNSAALEPVSSRETEPPSEPMTAREPSTDPATSPASSSPRTSDPAEPATEPSTDPATSPTSSSPRTSNPAEPTADSEPTAEPTEPTAGPMPEPAPDRDSSTADPATPTEAIPSFNLRIPIETEPVPTPPPPRASTASPNPLSLATSFLSSQNINLSDYGTPYIAYINSSSGQVMVVFPALEAAAGDITINVNLKTKTATLLMPQ